MNVHNMACLIFEDFQTQKPYVQKIFTRVYKIRKDRSWLNNFRAGHLDVSRDIWLSSSKVNSEFQKYY